MYALCVRLVQVSGNKRPYGHFEPDETARLATEVEFEAEEVDVGSAGYDSDSKVDRSAQPGYTLRGFSYPASSALPPKRRRESPEIVNLSDSDTSSKAASVATTRSGQSRRGLGPAASAEDHGLGLDARRTVPDHFVHRSMAAAIADKPLNQTRDGLREELHPAHPFIAKRQVRRSECSM